MGSIVLFLSAKQQTDYPKQQTDYPNIVVFLTDDQGYGDIGLHGNDDIETPVLDDFASQNIRFDHFYVSAVCAPTRASILTGRDHLRTGVHWVTHREEVMRSEEVTIAECLKEAGYATGCFGKWHNGAQFPEHPNNQGFDEFFGFCGGHTNNYFNPLLEHNGENIKTKGYIADILTDRAIDFIKDNREKPFFCYVPYNTPHGPLQVPEKYIKKYREKGLSPSLSKIYGMCENIDDNVGRVLDALDSLKLTDNTIVIFMSDNGPATYRYNAGMRGKKAQVHEGGLRVPFFMKIPNNENAKSLLIDEPTAHIDLLPTLLDLCNIPYPANVKLDGISLVQAIEGDVSYLKNREIYTHNQPWEVFEASCSGGYRDGQYRLVLSRERETMLFDLNADPLQENDLAQEKNDLLKAMINKYQAWFNDVVDGGMKPIPISIGYSQAPVIYCPAHESFPQNGATYSGEHGWAEEWVRNFNTPDAYTLWHMKVVEDGKYKVKLKYACSKANVGSNIEISIGDESLSNRVTVPIELEKKETNIPDWGILEMGVVFLKKGEFPMILRAKTMANTDAIHVKDVIIEKVE
ncbi:MAG: arylsulfatase [Bacteroidetes bacterium]|nr:arylsulfatase [Bacteroidota bacterium]